MNIIADEVVQHMLKCGKLTIATLVGILLRV